MKLAGKVALVTGSTTGIGEAIARLFAAEKATVMVHGLDREGGERVVRDITHAGGSAQFSEAKLEDPSACEGLIDATVRAFGGIDILVNNAAVMTRSNLDSTDVETFDRTIAINLRAPMLLIRAAAPHFRKAGGGAVVNIGSINGYCGENNQLAYAISKGGLITLSRNLADAHAQEGIRINHFNLGWVLTPNEYALKMREGLPADWPQHVAKTFAPSGRILSPEQIAHYALAFVSAEGGPVSGAVVDLEQYPVVGRNPSKSVS